MERLRRARAPLRGLITRTINDVEAELLQDPLPIDSLQDKRIRLEEILEQVAELDQRMLDQMMDDAVAEDVYEVEVVAIQENRDRVRQIRARITRSIVPGAGGGNPVGDDDAASNAVGQKKSFKLPKLELKKFNGQLTEWIAFWSQFRKIHEEEELHSTDKFQYLLQAMEPHSRPMEVVSSYPPSEDNYPKAVQALKDRFGSDDMLVEVYVRELLKLVISNVNSPHGKPRVSSFFDRIESHLRALETLGVTSDRFASMLFPLVESSLPEDTLRAWQRSPLAIEELVDGKTRLSLLIDFLRREVEAEERIKLARSGFGIPTERKRQRTSVSESEVPTAAGLHSGVSHNKCIFCDRQHESKDCGKAQEISLQDRKSKLESRRCCFTCLKPGHTSKKCRSYTKCPVCGRRHHVLLCGDLEKQRSDKATLSQQQSQDGGNTPSVTSSMSSSVCSSEVMLQTLFVRVCGARKSRLVRALVDSGSQRSYLLQSTAEELGIESSSTEVIIHALFGGHQTEMTSHSRLSVQMTRPDGKTKVQLNLLSHNRICGNIPRMSKSQVPWGKLKENGIYLSDFGEGTPPIEVLLGADSCGIILTGNGCQLGQGLVALETSLGWTVMGAIKPSLTWSREVSMTSQVISMTIHDYGCESMWALESLGIRDPAEAVTRQEQDELAKRKFLETLRRDPEGRYHVRLPWVSGDAVIPSNYQICIKRLESAVKKLDAQGMYAVYEKIFDDWEKEGIIEEVSLESGNQCHYLPHRPVFKPESLTTPVRPVFDASCRTAGNLSLNDILEKGANLLELIPSILIRFRTGRIGFTSDVRKAFQMIGIEECDRDMVRFLWYDKTRSSTKVLRHARVVFGVSSSSFLLGATIEHQLGNASKDDQPVAHKLLASIYVDNCVSSVDTMEEYFKFKEISTRLMAEARMDLRQWEETIGEVPEVGLPTYRRCGLGASGGHPQDVQMPPASNVLGIKWDRVRDSIYCAIDDEDNVYETTKRAVLSTLAKIFDRLGIVCPAVLNLKKIVQNSWIQKLGWDEQLQEEQTKEFKQFKAEMTKLRDVEIPRWLFTDSSQGSTSLLMYFVTRAASHTLQ